MKTILIATDFSHAASNAAAYGVELAKTMNARAILFSACEHVALPIAEIPAIIEPEELQQRVQLQLNEDARMLSSIHQIPLQTACCLGTAPSALLKTIGAQGADLVIAGMKTRQNKVRRWLGSTVTNWMHKLPVPMIIVPETSSFTYISSIALATDRDAIPGTEMQYLQALREVGERFHAQLYLIQVVVDNLPPMHQSVQWPVRLTEAMETLAPRYECITGTNIPSALVSFINLNNINLLALIPRQHPWYEKLFTTGVIRSMAWDCPVPLLVLPPANETAVAP